MAHAPTRETVAGSAQSARAISQTVLTEIFGPPAGRAFAVRYWDGAIEGPDATPHFILALRRPDALRRMFLPPSELTLAEAFLWDDYDIEGSMEDAAGLAEMVGERLHSLSLLGSITRHLFALHASPAPHADPDGPRTPHLSGSRHTRSRDASAIRHHYDVGNDFYRLWLDERMVYSCAYFPTGAEDLDAAQTAKLEHICRKLRLKPGERLLDIGCGWGGLILYAAQHYGVRALGVTLSRQQAELARERIAAAGLADRCQVELRDYRDLAPDQPFDKVVSVGMFEHVGRDQLPTYFTTAFRLTRPGGLFLNHGISTWPEHHPKGPGEWAFERVWQPGKFLWMYVFPDGELVTPSVAIGEGEKAGFEVRDVENLREHYMLTLRRWVRRLEAHHDEARRLVGEPTYRVWRLYMSGAAHSFAIGRNQLIQALFSKAGPAGASGLPPTREDLYRDG